MTQPGFDRSIDVEFSPKPRVALYVDGNYLLAVTRALNIKLDVEAFFTAITKDAYRLRTYWFSALESSLDRNNNAYRFLDRLRYIPRTKVYVGRMTKRSHGHYETALRTDAGISLGISMLELAQTGTIDAIYIVAADPEYVPALRAVQKLGLLVKLVYPTNLDDRSLEIHPDLLKNVDERIQISSAEMLNYEYISNYQDDTDKDSDYSDFGDEVDDDVDVDDLEVMEEEVDLDLSPQDPKPLSAQVDEYED